MIAGVGKDIIPLKGQIRVPIVIDKQTVTHDFAICDSLDNQFLVGMDLLEKMQAKIDLQNKKLITPRGEVEFFTKPIGINKRLKIRCNKKTTVKANSTGFIWGKIPIMNAKDNYEGVVEPYHKLAAKDGVFITGSLSYSKKNLIPIHYVNVTGSDVTIYGNQLVAFLEPLERSRAIHGVKKLDSSDSNYYDASIDIPRLRDADTIEETIENGRWNDTSLLHQQLQIDDMAISQNSKQELKNLISQYSHCFSRNRFDLGKASFYKARINLKRDWTPIWIPSKQIAYKLEPVMDQEITEMLEAGHITKCTYSLWNAMTFLVEKPNAQGGSKHRFVQDARALNSQSVQDSYELPRISSILDKMSSCEWLSNLDFQSSFTQIGLEKSSQPLTAFTYKGNRYMWQRMVMGQTSSSAQFSRCISQLFSRVPFESLILYIDDMLIWSSDEESHLRKLRFVLERLTWGNLKLNPKKTHLFRKEEFLGHKVSKNGIRLDEDKVRAVQELPAPTTVREVRMLLGSLNFYRKHIARFSQIAKPIYDLLKKGTKFSWTKECAESFSSLKKALTTSPVLGIPDVSDTNQSYQVTIDSSKKGQGATLTQEINGTRRVIAYWSRSVPKHQQRMGASRLELIALHGALQFWKLYLQGTKFVVLTDCRALLSLSKIFKNENSYFQRRLADLASFNFEIKHVSGKSSDMSMADFLSRHGFGTTTKEVGTQTQASTLSTKPKESQNDIHRILTISEAERGKVVTTDDIKREYSNDRVLSEVIKWVKDGSRPEDLDHRSAPKELTHYWKNFNLLTIKDDILYREWVDPVAKTRQPLIVVPCTLVERVLYTFHDTLATCHAGVAACVERCMKQFYFFKLKYEFELYIGSCITCARAKQPKSYLRAALKRSVYTEWNQAISIDHLEPSKLATRNGTVALFTICDMFSGYISCVPVSSTSTEASVKALLENWILRFGIPGTIQHDLGSGFTSALWKAIMKAFDIKDAKTTPKMSQSNGKAEACNRKINQAMRVTLSPKEYQDYDRYIKYIVFCLNSLANSKTGFSPYFLVHGRECRMPRDMMVQDDSRLDEVLMSDDDINYRTKKQAYDLYRRVSQITRIARDKSEKRAQYMETQYNKRIKGPFFSVGDMCLVLELWPKHKYQDKFQGPFLITEKINDHNYVINMNGKKKVVSISKMKWFPKDGKYSRTPTSEPPPQGDKTTKTDKATKKAVSKLDDSDSSDTGSVIITFDDPPRRRSPRIAARSKTAAATNSGNNVEVHSAELATGRDRGGTDAIVLPDDQVVADDSDVLDNADRDRQEVHQSGGDNNDVITSNLQTDVNDNNSEHEFVDAVQDLADDSTGATETNRGSALTPGSSNADRSSIFRGIDTRVSLSDIEARERQLGRRVRDNTSIVVEGTTPSYTERMLQQNRRERRVRNPPERLTYPHDHVQAKGRRKK
ncbi:MAG: DDE-type integrase/transposase/recombinase [Gammaproteobacteria bacterium]|nr:DDE-type integrase/transposase/recombinase [Gammaproteobacteria bacterium]